MAADCLSDNKMSIEFTIPRDVQRELASRFRVRRLALNLTQEGLAARSGVSWSSLKRFEHTGLIAVDALLRLALVLGCLADFDQVCKDDRRALTSKTLDELLSEPKSRKKGPDQVTLHAHNVPLTRFIWMRAASAGRSGGWRCANGRSSSNTMLPSSPRGSRFRRSNFPWGRE